MNSKKISLCLQQFSRTQPVIRFTTACLLLDLLARLFFFINSCQNSVDSIQNRVVALTLGLTTDLFVLFLILVPLMLLNLAYQKTQPSKFFATLFHVILFSLYFIMVVLFLIDQNLYHHLFIGISYTFLQSYLLPGQFLPLVSFVSLSEWVFLIIALVAYFIIQRLDKKNLHDGMIYGLMPIYLLLMTYGAAVYANSTIVYPGKRFMLMMQNPEMKLLNSYWNSQNAYQRDIVQVSAEQQQNISLLDPLFLNTSSHQTPLTLRSAKTLHHWNIIFFVLESVGSTYIFDQQNTHTLPMPFLKQLAKKGVWFENHYTSGNISALGQFSILTGLYPNPTPTHFEMQTSLFIPTISHWLGKPYDSFFVSSSNDLYFAIGLNHTFADYANAKTIAPGANLFYHMFLDETVGFQYFLNRLKRTQVPFVGVYWSGAAHYPYKDYSQSAAINQQIFYPYPRYQNSLRLLDNEIKALYSQLKKQHLLEDTILVVVGDHGEIFGQHDNAWVHGQSLYQEEIKVPLLIYAPALFKSQQVHAVTSSADILPTILAAIHQTPSSYFQGESLLAPLKRDYIFIYNDNDEIAAISQQQIKMRISFANNTCLSYDLIHDPQEAHPLPCTDLKQKQAILAFRHYQPALLQRLNRL